MSYTCLRGDHRDDAAEADAAFVGDEEGTMTDDRDENDGRLLIKTNLPRDKVDNVAIQIDIKGPRTKAMVDGIRRRRCPNGLCNTGNNGRNYQRQIHTQNWNSYMTLHFLKIFRTVLLFFAS
jgi:hypothetical protein